MQWGGWVVLHVVLHVMLMYMERMCHAVGGFNLIDAEHGRRGMVLYAEAV